MTPREKNKSKTSSIPLTKMETARYRNPSGLSSLGNYLINSTIKSQPTKTIMRVLMIRPSKRLIFSTKCPLNKSNNYLDSLMLKGAPAKPVRKFSRTPPLK